MPPRKTKFNKKIVIKRKDTGYNSKNSNSNDTFIIKNSGSVFDVDDVDHSIITILKEDGKATIKEISQATGIRPSTVHQRIQGLVSDKVIEKFTIKTNDAAVGEDFIAFLLVKGSTQKYLSSRILEDSRVKEVFGVTGEYDVLIKMKFSSVLEFNEYIIEFRKHNPEIITTLSMVGTANLKEEL